MTRKRCQIIPEDEKQCVWMAGGLISYKLCTRDYRCEGCVFDQVIRNEAAVVNSPNYFSDSTAASSSRTAVTMPQTSALFYHQNHCWVRVENPEEAFFGIDGILARLVSQIKTVSLPQAGEAVTQGHCFAHIIQERHIVQLVSPLSGTILSVNHLLKKTPEILTGDPWGEGWLVSIKPDNLEHDLRSLMFGKKAMDWYQQKELELTIASESILNAGNETELGPTMQDGGEKITCLADVLTPEQYERILDAVSQV